jgi:hypothetical protein
MPQDIMPQEVRLAKEEQKARKKKTEEQENLAYHSKRHLKELEGTNFKLQLDRAACQENVDRDLAEIAKINIDLAEIQRNKNRWVGSECSN